MGTPLDSGMENHYMVAEQERVEHQFWLLCILCLKNTSPSIVPVVGLGCRVATVTRGRDRRRHGIGKVGHDVLPEKLRWHKVTRVGVDGISAVPAPVAMGTRTKRGEEQRNMKMRTTRKGERKK